jgi:integral membrane protein
MKNGISLLRKASVAEGISFLLLLGVAMPLKYIAGLPIAVKIAGSLHGALFILLIFMLIKSWEKAAISFRLAGLIFLASLVPFAPFFMDRKLAALTGNADA